MARLALLVLRAKDPTTLADFYAGLGFEFKKEQHGKGAVHYACLIGDCVLEIYPEATPDQSTRGIRIGLQVPSISLATEALPSALIKSQYRNTHGSFCILEDPEGHTIELSEPGRAQ